MEKLEKYSVQSLLLCSSLLFLIIFSGCGDFFSEKPTEVQTKMLLSEMRQIKENPNVKNTIPELYRRAPEMVKVKDGVKLFYFTKQQTVEKMSELITAQMKMPVNINTSSNQIVVHCPDEAEAQKVVEFLEMVDVPPLQVNIDCLIIERFANTTMDWETTIQIENLFGENIIVGGGKIARNSSGAIITNPDGTPKILPAFPGSSLRESKRSDFGLDIGYISKNDPGHNIKAVVDMLIQRGYLKVMMNPTIETVNGKEATIEAKEYVPIEKSTLTPYGQFYNLTDYIWVKDSLKVTPFVFSDGSISLITAVSVGSRAKPEGVVQNQIITEDNIIIQENRIKPGDSLVIGGIRKTEEVSIVRGTPFLKDLPIIGILFSSKDYEERAKEIIFILTPSISSGGVEHAKVIDAARKKYNPPKWETGWKETLTDPFGSSLYTTEVEKKAAEAEFARIKASIEKAEAEQEVKQAKEKLLEAAEKIMSEKAAATQARTEAEASKQDAEKSRVAAEQSKTLAEQAKQESTVIKSEAEKAIAEALTSKQSAEQQQQMAQQEKLAAEQAKAAAEVSKKESEKSKAESEQIKAAAEVVKQQAAKDKAEAELAKANAEAAKEEANKIKEKIETLIKSKPVYEVNTPDEPNLFKKASPEEPIIINKK